MKSLIVFLTLWFLVTTGSNALQCPGDGCSKHGKCDVNLGICQCDSGWTGGDCASRPITTLGYTFQKNLPLVNMTITDVQDSYQSMVISEMSYSGLVAIEEYNSDGEIAKVVTPPTWSMGPVNDTTLFSRVNYSAPLAGGGNVIVTIYQTKANSNTTFLGQVLTLTPNQQYFTVLVEGYKFVSPDNHLTFVFEMGMSLPENSTRVCILRSQDNFSDSVVNYRLHLNDVMMNGRFIERALLDGQGVDTSSEFGRFQQRNTDAATQILLDIPAFNQSAVFAQDFLPTLNAESQANIKSCISLNRPNNNPTTPPSTSTPSSPTSTATPSSNPIPPEPSPTIQPSVASSIDFNLNLIISFILLGCLFSLFF
ncbi:hypothetical protein CYY_007572 [Polysphondylium violaceum]|uniref:EGF-like domain-containing protein n=1 Tax=Polysphondylium violaceum TaxID=133409 RepID=A0A8J4PQ87_9MYCE|nr:hypothetical protein CYY_007572 [Polysphondylium violaceum]